MENVIYKIGQKIESKSESHDYETSAEFVSVYKKYYGFISEIVTVTESVELPDGTSDSITTIEYYAISMRTEIDRQITFNDGHQYAKEHIKETINFPLNRVYIGVDDCSEEYSFTAVNEFSFTHDLSLFG